MSEDEKPPKNGQASILPFDPGDMTKLRVNQSQFAKMLGCSRQRISQLVQEGKISLFPDGTLDPQRAHQEYLVHVDPTRMRSRLLKPIAEEMDTLKSVNAGLADDLRAKHLALQWVLGLLAEHSAWLEKFSAMVEEKGDDLRATTAEQWPELVQDLFDEAGEHASVADPRAALAALDDGLADLWQPAQP